MTIGKKISYLRKMLKITQEELAEKTGIHVVSIRRYENDKMVPKEVPLSKIASVLNVKPSIFSENTSNYDIETDGDFYSLLITMSKANIIDIIKTNSGTDVYIEINEKISNLFNLAIKDYEQPKITKPNLTISINENLKKLPSYNLFIKWIDATEGLKGFINSLSDKDNPVAVSTVNTIKEQIEKYELELIQSDKII